MTCTTVIERLKFCDEHFHNIAGILTRNDSASYTFMKYQEIRPALDEEFKQSTRYMIHEQRQAQFVKVLNLTQVSSYDHNVCLAFVSGKKQEVNR